MSASEEVMVSVLCIVDVCMHVSCKVYIVSLLFMTKFDGQNVLNSVLSYYHL